MIQELTAAGISERPTPAHLFERFAIHVGKRLLKGNVQGSLLVTLPSGRRVRVGRKGNGHEAELKLNSFALARNALRRGSIGFAESYIDGDFETPDLLAVFQFFVRNEELFANAGRGFFKVRGLDRIAHSLRRNSLSGSRRNIAEHYDLGNAFFEIWLDPDLNYSSALYENAEQPLEVAQKAKLDLVARMAGIEKEDEVLEIGCGWGAMARHMAGLGADVTAITLSQEQLAHARAEASRRGLTERNRFLLQDYRKVTGQFDRIVSIEMIEAVGQTYWETYFKTLHDRLRPGGSAAIQAITIEEKRFDSYSRSADFIQRYIFPGGMLLTKQSIDEHARKAGLVPAASQCFGESYARTLREWCRRFDENWPQIAALGFDERFGRMWRYYLIYCEAGFLDGSIDVGVYRLEKPSAA